MLILAIFAILFPIYIMLKTSLADRDSIVTGGRYPEPLWPFDPNLDQFGVLFGKKDFITSGLFSLWVALMSVAFALLLGTPAAFALARFKFPGMGVLALVIIGIRLFPDVASAIRHPRGGVVHETTPGLHPGAHPGGVGPRPGLGTLRGLHLPGRVCDHPQGPGGTG
jgi:hypothetical protein